MLHFFFSQPDILLSLHKIVVQPPVCSRDTESSSLYDIYYGFMIMLSISLTFVKRLTIEHLNSFFVFTAVSPLFSLPMCFIMSFILYVSIYLILTLLPSPPSVSVFITHFSRFTDYDLSPYPSLQNI